MGSVKPDPAPTSGWVLMAIPDELRMGPVGIADRCQWDLKGRPDGLWEVRLRERAWTSPRVVLQAELLVRANEAAIAERYHRVAAWPGQDQYIDVSDAQVGLAHVQELLGTPSREAWWEAVTLLTLVARDTDWTAHLRGLYERIALELPRSSVWTVTIDPVIHARKTIVRALVAADAAKELLDPNRDFVGLQMGTGLAAMDAVGVGPLTNAPLLSCAPGLLGIVGARLAGLIVILFGQFEAGRPAIGPTSLIDLYRPNLLASPVKGAIQFKRPTPSHVEEMLIWWSDRLNHLYGVLLDPVNYQDAAGAYDAVEHYGDILSVDRLVAAVNSTLVGSRREEFARRLMFFEALDILEGLRQGSYRSLLDRVALKSTIDKMRSRIPKRFHPFLLPRCERALEALIAVDEGWYLKDRISSAGLSVSDSDGIRTVPLNQAAADYLRLVRNGGHALRVSLDKHAERSLFVSHSGVLRPELSDIAFVHFLQLIVEPNRLRPKVTGRSKRLGT